LFPSRAASSVGRAPPLHGGGRRRAAPQDARDEATHGSVVRNHGCNPVTSCLSGLRSPRSPRRVRPRRSSAGSGSRSRRAARATQDAHREAVGQPRDAETRRTEVGFEPSGNGGFAPVGITLLMGAKKLHMPAVGDSLVRARGAAASASGEAGRLLERSTKRLSDLRSRVARLRSDMEDGMESFWDRDGEGQHDAFDAWRRENSGGFVINCRTATDMWLHRPDCPHFKFRPGTKVSLARNRKICSLDRGQLEQWAKKRGTLKSCSGCL